MIGIAKRLVLVALVASPAMAQTAHNHSSAHTGHLEATTLSEPGQGAFAAISEIVSLLESSPSTDWSKVDLDGLRAHLIDMDMLMTHSVVETSPIESGLQMRISLTGEGGPAASRMVPAHAPVLAAETGWKSSVNQDGEVIVWTVTSKKNAQKIKALGFYGLMAVGDHHREHHLQMATGQNMH